MQVQQSRNKAGSTGSVSFLLSTAHHRFYIIRRVYTSINEGSRTDNNYKISHIFTILSQKIHNEKHKIT